MGSGASSEERKENISGGLNDDRKIYRLLDMHGDGHLLPWLIYANNSGDTSFLEGELERMKDFMYNGGKGKLVAITELVKLRNKERNERLGAFSRKKGKGKSGPNILDDFNQENENAGDLKKALKLLDGGGKGGKNESKYREITWRLEERGSMGETLIGICLLQGTDIHNQLALRILDTFPRLINDIYISEDHYGLSLLHQAIINQDTRMVYILLKRGADVNQRCYGGFFCAEDQKPSRTDSLEHEYVELSMKTNYTGSMYFGEYPLSFAACMNQPDSYRLLLANKANSNAQDTNGNTVLHMCVIHENMAMFKVALESGASLRMMNKQNLTPLTLAAKMGKRKMFEGILEIEGERIWSYGGASCTAYPLAKIDTINENTGELNDNSALALAVYGEKKEHLELIEGLLETLLEEKWEQFARTNLLQSLGFFIFHWMMAMSAFFLRQIHRSTEILTEGWIDRFGNALKQGDRVGENTQTAYFSVNDSYRIPYTEDLDMCHLRDYWFDPYSDRTTSYARMVTELVLLVSVGFQITMDFKDIRHIGRAKWWSILKAFPAKIAYKMSFALLLLMIPIRMACGISSVLLILDNILATAFIILTTIHFLFYCRAVPFVGPFVLMIYTIISTDLLRFLLIYGIFLMGFSQSFYLVFLSCERESNIIRDVYGVSAPLTDITQVQDHFINDPKKNLTLTLDQFTLGVTFDNVIQNPAEAFIRTFILTIGEFTVLYRNLGLCPSPIMIWIGKGVFLIFELGVSILQFNLLIAMMTRTYENIFRTTTEYKRQWAQVILMLEVSLSSDARTKHLLKYSLPTKTNKRQRSLVVNKMADAKKAQEDKEEKAQRMAEEKKALVKRKIREMELKEGLRPLTAAPFGATPRPMSRPVSKVRL